MALPLTGFEQRGQTPPWSTFPEEAAYFTALLAQVPGITRTQIGVGATNLPLYTYTVGTGPHKIYFVAHQHAPERASREALMIKIREWAANPALAAYLQQATIIALPTARPDSQGVRNNANGVNLNRDHMHISQPETQAIHSVIRTHQPGVIIDMHEGRNITEDFATSPLLNPNLAPGLTSLAASLEQAIRAGIETSGHTWEAYQNHNLRGPEYLVNAIGVHHAVGILQESRWPQDSDTEMPRRMANHLAALDSIIAWHANHLTQVATAQAESRVWAATQTQVTLNGGTSLTGPVLEPSPDGYLVSPQQEAALSSPAAAFGLEFVDTDEGRMLATQNQSGLVAHYLSNALSPQALIMGLPWWEERQADEEFGDPPWPRYYTPGPSGPRLATMVRLGTNAGAVTVWP